MTANKRSEAHIHIDRTPIADGNAPFEKARFDLTLSDAARPERLAELARDLAARIEPYSAAIELTTKAGNRVLHFENDRAPLDKYEMGRINQEAVMAHVERLEGPVSS